MPRNNHFTIRFGVKDNENQRSRTWKMWTKNNDVYLLERNLGHLFKASLHASGCWQISLSSEYAHRRQLKNQGRHIEKWRRPESNIAKGITLAFRLLVPLSELRDYPNNTDSNNIIWLNAPKAGQAIEIAIVFTHPEVIVKGWPGKKGMDNKLLGETTLNNGERLWLVYRDIKLTSKDIKLLRTYKEKSNEPTKGMRQGGILIGSELDNSRKFMEVALN